MKPSINTSIATCPKCHQKIPMKSAFCPYCGVGLFMGRATKKNDIPQPLSQPPKVPTEIQQKWQSTTLLFLLWIFEFSLVICSAIYLHFYHQRTALTISLFTFLLTWGVLAKRLKQADQRSKGIKGYRLYIELLIPVVGTIYAYYRINDLHLKK